MKLSMAQLDVKRGDPSHNLDLIQRAAQQASAQGSDLVCLPEMATTGFDWKRNRELLAASHEHHREVAKMAKAHDIAVCGSFLEQSASGNACNTLLYFDRTGALLATYRKIYLFTLFREDRHVEPGRDFVVRDIHHCRAGFAICYDLRFPELFRKNTELGAEIQILPAAFPYPRLEHYRTLVAARAIENQCFFIAVNQSGVEGHGESVGATRYFGHSTVVDPWGEIVAEADDQPELITVEIDLSRVGKIRSKMTVLNDRRPELY